jgi:hypothetical protein
MLGCLLFVIKPTTAYPSPALRQASLCTQADNSLQRLTSDCYFLPFAITPLLVFSPTTGFLMQRLVQAIILTKVMLIVDEKTTNGVSPGIGSDKRANGIDKDIRRYITNCSRLKHGASFVN